LTLRKSSQWSVRLTIKQAILRVLYRCPLNGTELSVAVANATAKAFVSELKSVAGAAEVLIVDEARTADILSNGKSEQLKTRLNLLLQGSLLHASF
jgi:hypothetical protein